MVAQPGQQADNRVMRSALAVVLLTIAASPQFACLTKAAREHEMAKTTLAGLCDAYTEAEKKTPDPGIAYEDVADHFITLWQPLKLAKGSIGAAEAAARYEMWLRFARHDYGVEGWSCPALDRLLLGMVDRQEAKTNTRQYPIVRVAASGEVSIDGEVVALADLKERLARLTEERGHTVNLYREGWARRMPPHSDAVLTKLVNQGFMIAVCAKPHCPD